VVRIHKGFGIAAALWALACSAASDATDATGVSGGPEVNPPTPPSGQIAFVGPAGQLEVMNADGSNVKTLTAGRGSDPAWSPDGAKLAFTGDSGIFLMNADGTGAVQLTDGGMEPSWSPDGSRVAFVMLRWDSTGTELTLHQRIAVVNADGSGFAWLSAGPHDDSPAWSPDGARIALVRNSDDGLTPSAIYIMTAANPSIMIAPSYLPQGDLCAQSAPAWTPDGKSLLFWTACPNGPSNRSGPFGFALASSDGSGTMTPIVSDVAETYNSKPAWSPDGKWIVFASPGVEYEEINSTVYVMQGKGSKAIALAQGTKPAWRPAR
jgi:TolB protein